MQYVYYHEESKKIVISTRKSDAYGKEIGSMDLTQLPSSLDVRFFVSSLLDNAGIDVTGLTITQLPDTPE